MATDWPAVSEAPADKRIYVISSIADSFQNTEHVELLLPLMALLPNVTQVQCELIADAAELFSSTYVLLIVVLMLQK
jgi:hypothetical protein